MRFIIFGILLLSFQGIEARRDADSIYDRQLDKSEERRILYYNRWFKQHKQQECVPEAEETCASCPCPQPCPCYPPVSE